MAAPGSTNSDETRLVGADETHRCRGCGGKNTPALTSPVDLAVYPLEQGHRLMADHSMVTAWVCPDCGLVDFYADRPERFRRPVRPRRVLTP